MLRAAIASVALILTASLAAGQTPADSRLKRIADSKTLKIGYRAAATPFSFFNQQTKEPAGYTIDLCRLAAEWIGKSLNAPLKIEWVEVTTQNRFDLVAQGLSMDEAIERIAFPDNPEKWASHGDAELAQAAE